MKNLMFHMNIDTDLEFFTRVKDIEESEKRVLDERERTEILAQMATEGLIKTVIETGRTKEQNIRDTAKHGKTLYIKSDRTKEII